MKIAIVTMVYNERVNLPIWSRHYRAHCHGAALFVLDHGSDDGSTDHLPGVNLIPLPRSPFDDGDRAATINDLQRALLRFYDVVIYTDCDEMLVADPRLWVSLTAFLSEAREDVTAGVGLMLRHLPSDPDIDLSAPLLGQRRHVESATGYCKPAIVRAPTTWTPGFHWCDRVPAYRTDLFLFHIHEMDTDIAIDRLRLTNSMAWSARALANGWGVHQRQSDITKRREGLERRGNRLAAAESEPFEFSDHIELLRQSLQFREGFWFGEKQRVRHSIVPDEFGRLI